MLPALAVALALGACGEDGEESKPPPPDPGGYDRARYESTLRGLLSSPGGAGGAPQSEVTRVTCPARVREARGTEFECRVSGEDELEGTVRVTLEDDRAKTFRYEGKLESAAVTQTVSGNSSIK